VYNEGWLPEKQLQDACVWQHSHHKPSTYVAYVKKYSERSSLLNTCYPWSFLLSFGDNIKFAWVKLYHTGDTTHYRRQPPIIIRSRTTKVIQVLSSAVTCTLFTRTSCRNSVRLSFCLSVCLSVMTRYLFKNRWDSVESLVCGDQISIGVPDRAQGEAVAPPPWIWETSKIRADGMGNSGIQGTEFF